MGLKRVLKVLLEVRHAGWQITRKQRQIIEEEMEDFGVWQRPPEEEQTFNNSDNPPN